MRSVKIILGLMLAASSMSAGAREAFTVNDGWSFTFANDTVGKVVHLPYCWNEDAYSTRDYRRGKGVYGKRLRIPSRFEGKRIFLRLDGAASKSDVAVDGKPVGSHIGAYSSHMIDVTPFVKPGATHLLTVSVDNSDKDIPPYSADFTFMGGLYRDVWLLALDPVHLDLLSGSAEGVKVTSHLLPDGSGRLEATGNVVNDSGKRERLTVSGKLYAPDGREVASSVGRLTIPPDSEDTFSLDFGSLKGVSPWSPDSPALYRLVTEITGGKGELLDSAVVSVGFRSFGFDSDGAFLLNGEPVKLRGMCRHQDQHPMGIALTDEQHRRDLQLIKDMGANFIRISHYPQDDALLEMCDRLGLIAWEEIPVIDYLPDSERFNQNSEIMLREMIRRHYNHPSVVMWGYMNEILLRTPKEEQEAVRERTRLLARHLEDVLKQEDPSRLSTMAFHGSDVYHEAALSDITDVKGWNLYQGWYGGSMDEFEQYLSRQHRQHPLHKLIVSEYGAGSDLRIHSLKPQPFDFSMEYQQEYLEHYLPVIEDSTFVAGASHWNFIDFSSANRAESMPHINNKGLVTNDRRRKDVYYYYKASWTPLEKDTIVHIASRDWPRRTEIGENHSDGVVRPVKVYTNLPAVALSVNGSMIGVKEVGNHTALFDIPLRDGKNVVEIFPVAESISEGKITCMMGRPLDAMTVDLRLLPVLDGKIALGEGELAINVGSDCYFTSDDTGLTWLPDREYEPGALYGHIGGKRSVSQDEIGCTSDGPLFQRMLGGLEEYRIDVPDGRYEVELGFADLSSPSHLSAYMLGHNAGSGSPVADMDISINGHRVEENLSPATEVGVKNMLKRRYETLATNGNGILVDFTPANGNTSLSTIKIRKL